jgi:hypothetical protein
VDHSAALGQHIFQPFRVMAAKNMHGYLFLLQAPGQCAADEAGAAEQQYAIAAQDLRSSSLW